MPRETFQHCSLSFDWILLHSEAKFQEEGFQLLFQSDNNCFYSNAPFLKKENNTGFLFGKFLPKVKNESHNEFSDDFKGYYTYIHYNTDIVAIQNDYFGISKFFYSVGKIKVISSRLDLVVKYAQPKLYPEGAILYLLFNYYILGRTIFENVFYSEPATKLVVGNNNMKIETYRTFPEPTIKEKKREQCIQDLAELWIKIIRDTYSEKRRFGLTLTGGYDSRLILGGLLKHNINPTAFTFGHPESGDAVTAKMVASAINIKHKIIPFDYCSHSKLIEDIKKITFKSGGLLNPFRSIRLRAIENMYMDVDTILFGYGGSEILRGIFPDGLLVSDFYANFIKTNDFSEKTIKKYLEKFKITPEESIIVNINKILTNNIERFGQFFYMINVILPMHFGEDLRYLLKSGYDCYSPFIDEDFFKTALTHNLVPLYNENAKGLIKDTNYKRIDNPKTSAKLMHSLNNTLANLDLNRGYSPMNYIHSKHYAGFRLLIKKYLKKKNPPVTELNPWLNTFFKLHFPRNDFGLNFNIQQLFDTLNSEHKTEYDFIPWIRAWNINEKIKIFLNSEYPKNNEL